MPQENGRAGRGAADDAQLDDLPVDAGAYDDIDAGAPYSKTQYARTHEAGAGQHRDAAFYHEAAAHHHRQAADFHEQHDPDEAERHAALAKTHSETAHEHSQTAHDSTRPADEKGRRSGRESQSVRGPDADVNDKRTGKAAREGKTSGRRRSGGNGRRRS